MASFDEHGLDITVGGAVVLLREPARSAWTENWEGIRAHLAVDSRGLVLEGMPVLAAAAMRQEARTAANHVLDLICARSAGAMALAEPAAPAIVWGPGTDGPWVQASMEVQTTFSLSAGGPWAYPLSWHPSMRYFRMSQTTTDLYDAFRNLYLGLESLLGDVAPMRLRANGSPAEQERAWTLRALGEADQLLSSSPAFAQGLSHYLPAPVAASPADDVMAELYGLRTEVFHAKTGRPVALPQSQHDQERVREALDRYGRMFTDLLERRCGARFLRSGISDYFAGEMLNRQLSTWEVGLVGRSLTSLEEVESGGLEDMVVLPTRRAPELDGSARHGAILGVVKNRQVSLPAPVRSIGILGRDDGSPVSGDFLGGDLRCDGFEQVEVAAFWQLASAGTKKAYDS